MVNIRWKKQYLSGDAGMDERNRALVALLSDIGAELARKEHCAEITELYAELVELTKNGLSELSVNPETFAETEESIRELLKNQFPLATLSTPACRQCGLCDLMKDRVAEWASQGAGNRGH